MIRRGQVFLVAMEADQWRVASIDARGAAEMREAPRQRQDPSGEVLEPLLAILRELGYAGQRVCLGLPSEQVLAATVDAQGLPRHDRAGAMLYRLEEELPLEAEALAARFLPLADGRAMGLSVERAPLEAVLEQLLAAGVRVGAAAATALLAMEDCLPGLSEPVEYVLVAGPRALDLFRLVQGRPCGWQTLPHDPLALRQCLRADRLANEPQADLAPPAALVVGALAPELAEVLGQECAPLAAAQQQNPLESAARTAQAVLRGRGAAWMDLAPGLSVLGNRWRRLVGPLRLTATLAAAVLIVATGVCCWRAVQYDRMARQLWDEQKEQYRRVFPVGTVPQGIRSRLASEALHLSGSANADVAPPAPPNALTLMAQVLSHLPADVRLRVTEMELTAVSVLLAGEVRSHGDAELIAKALQEAGLSLDPPRTDLLPSGAVSFTLRGRPGVRSRGPTIVGGMPWRDAN